MNDPSPTIRKFVVRSLGRINTPEVRAKLKEIKTKDPESYVRKAASSYLKQGRRHP